jgi:endoglucanase
LATVESNPKNLKPESLAKPSGSGYPNAMPTKIGSNRVVVALSLLAGLAWTATPVEQHGALAVVSGQVVDKNGVPPQLRGMSLYWSQAKVGRDFYNTSVVDWLATDWNVKVVRAALAVEGDWSPVEKGYLSDAQGNTARIKTVVDAAIAKGIYVVIDWHDHDAIKHQAQAVSFFTEMSQLYGKQPNVIFEIFNEPLDISWSSIKSYSQTVIQAIRKNSDNLIVVGTPKWASELIPPAKDPITGFKNVAYAFHMYASEEWHHKHYIKRADSAIAMGLPLFVSEWGLTPASGNGNINMQWVEEFWSWMESRKLSSCAWSLSDASETSAALKAVTWNGDGSAKHNVSTTGGWSTSDLTQSGNWLRDKFRQSNTVSTVPKPALPSLRMARAGRSVAVTLEPGVPAASLRVADLRGKVRFERSAVPGGTVRFELAPGVYHLALGESPAIAFVVP